MCRFLALSIVAAFAFAGTGPSQPLNSPAGTAGLPMGELVGRDARVAVFATRAGTRFDIRALDGTTVAAGLTADQVAALLPGQDPRGVFAQEDAPTAIMFAEQARMPE